MIRPIHTKVPGRARFRISGLFHSKTLKRFLENRLTREKDVLSVSASVLTGNILLTFNSSNDHHTIGLLIESVIASGWPEPSGQETSQQAVTAEKPHDKAQKSPPFSSRKPRQNKKTLRSPRFADQPMGQWHLKKTGGVLKFFNTDPERGIDSVEAARRLRRYGPNRLPEAAEKSKWAVVFGQLNSLPVYLLAAAAGVSAVTGGILDAAVILGVVAANAAIGYVTESKAEKTIQSLKTMVRPYAEVLRNGEPKEIPAPEVVAGDLLTLKPGMYVAADCRILKSTHLSVDESMLTGESMPVFKQPYPLKRPDVPLPDRTNMAYMGTLITGGQGLAVAVATGSFSEIGRLQALLDRTEAPKTPIERQLEQMGDHLVLLCGAVCALVFFLGFFRGYGLARMLRSAISLAAAAVPEGLPAAATINFALGINRMRAHRVLIRQLQAVETLGAVQTVCLDKTGTITLNRMSVQRLFVGDRRITFSDPDFQSDKERLEPQRIPELWQMLEVCALCSETKVNGSDDGGCLLLSGSATENALIHLAHAAGVDVSALRADFRCLKVRHRAENRLFMSTLHGTPDGGRRLLVKGSPPDVTTLCSRKMVNGRTVPLTDEDRERIERENESMSGDALRVLGAAFSDDLDKEPEEDENGLVWLGLVGMSDPIRNSVRELIQVFHRAGIDTVMITGDQSNTAFAVAQRLDISGGKPLEILDSSKLTALPPKALQALARKAHAYSRVSPAHKLRIVQALQQSGLVVAMTGDGINDGPALKAADIGIAMGRGGTDVAREVADVVLKEDNLEALIIAVKDGRATYRNIRKSVHFFLSTNLSEIMIMLAAMALGIGFPLSVMQLLWINIISDIFPGLALSLEEPAANVMDRPPRNAQAPLFSRADFTRMAFESGVMTAGALGAYLYGIRRYGAGSLGAGSLAFQALTIGQLLHAYSCKSETSGLFDRNRPPKNPWLFAAVGGSLALQVLTFVVPPLRRFLSVAPPRLIDTAVIGAAAAAPLLINEATKQKRVVKP